MNKRVTNLNTNDNVTTTQNNNLNSQVDPMDAAVTRDQLSGLVDYGNMGPAFANSTAPTDLLNDNFRDMTPEDRAIVENIIAENKMDRKKLREKVDAELLRESEIKSGLRGGASEPPELEDNSPLNKGFVADDDSDNPGMFAGYQDSDESDKGQAGAQD